jgi:LPXTG-motif cell wall-anchored protein
MDSFAGCVCLLKKIINIIKTSKEYKEYATSSSFLAWLFYLKLISNIGASESGDMVAMFPAIGRGRSILMGETQISLNLIVGIVLACLGAYLALKKKEIV